MAKTANHGDWRRQPHTAPKRQRRFSWGQLGTYAGVVLAFVAVAGMLVLLSRSSSPAQQAAGKAMTGPAPDFTLPTVGGGDVSLASFRGKENVLLFFNEGYGCGPCWQQALEMQQRLADLKATNTAFLTIMVDPPDLLAPEVKRWGLTVPVLDDTSRTAAQAYNTLGFGMHADKPNHTFVFIDKAGVIRWWKDYASMRAPADEVIKKVQSLASS